MKSPNANRLNFAIGFFAFQSTNSYEEKLLRIQYLLDCTDKEIENITCCAKKLVFESRWSLYELLEDLYFKASAGWTYEEILDWLAD